MMKGVNRPTNNLLKNLVLGQYEHRRQRVALHATMWMFMCIIYYVLYSRSDPSPMMVLLIAFKDLLCVMLIFYAIFYTSGHAVVNKRKMLFYIIYIMLGFVFWNIVTSIFFTILPTNRLLTLSPTLERYANLLKYPNVLEVLSPKLVLYQLQDFVFIAMPPIYVKTIIEISRTLNRNTVLTNEKLQLEITLLKSQINPHFLFNNLNNIYLLALKKDDNTPDMVLSLSNMLRYTLYDSESEKVSIREEIQFVNSYIALEKVRHQNGNINLSIKGEEEDVHVIPFLLSTLVENAFKHGMSSTNQPYAIAIDITVENDFVYFKVVNDFLPNAKNLHKKGGVGLKNLRSRLHIYYANSYEYRFEIKDNLYIARIKVPRI